MQLETYNHKKDIHHHRRKVARKNFLIFTVFIFVISTILFSVYSTDGISFTGMSILPSNSNITSPIQASLSIPELTLKNEFHELKIIVNKDSSIIIGGKTFSIKESEREIILKDFQGTISFDDEKIYILKGKVSEIILSGIPITTDKNKIDIELNSGTHYKQINIVNNFSIKSLDYYATGELKINEDVIKANKEQVFLNNYIGNLIAENKTLFLNGKIGSVEIHGDNRNIKIS